MQADSFRWGGRCPGVECSISSVYIICVSGAGDRSRLLSLLRAGACFGVTPQVVRSDPELTQKVNSTPIDWLREISTDIVSGRSHIRCAGKNASCVYTGAARRMCEWPLSRYGKTIRTSLSTLTLNRLTFDL